MPVKHKSRPDCALPFATRPQPTAVRRQPNSRCFCALSNDNRVCAAYRCRGLSLRRRPAHRSPPLADRQSSCRVLHHQRFPPPRTVYPGVDPRRLNRETACHSRNTLLNCRNNPANHTNANHMSVNRMNVNHRTLNRRTLDRSSANCRIVNRSCGGDFFPAQNWELLLPPKSSSPLGL